MKTMKDLLDSPANRLPDGSLTDAAYAAYKSTSAQHPEGFIPDDELKMTEAVPLNATETVRTAKIGNGGYKATIVRDTPGGDKWAVNMPLRNGRGQDSYTPHRTLAGAVDQVESAEDFGGWL